jgi:cysteinyl-tRNA synthetase
LTNKKEKFQPKSKGIVKMFVCGPTVYDSVHLGHARTYLFYDLLTRYLKVKGFEVRFVVNITDIDDKVFDKAEKEGVDFNSIANKYTQEFKDCLKSLGIFSIEALHKASDYLGVIEKHIGQLIESGHAYQVNGNIFFDTSSFPEYGKLSNQTLSELKLRRLDPDPMKRDQMDFILWRSWNVKSPSLPSILNIESPSFPSKFGQGRPGWHIEDTAISISTFGSTYDIHGGAIELVFPHHEAEIAQAESLTGQRPFVKYWVHTGLLTINNEKMSKSLGNIVTLNDAIERFGAKPLRLYLLSKHYQDNFILKMNEIRTYQDKIIFINKAVVHMKSITCLSGNKLEKNLIEQRLQKHIIDFFRSMDDNLDTPKAIDSLMKLLTEINNCQEEINQKLFDEVMKILSIIGITPN